MCVCVRPKRSLPLPATRLNPHGTQREMSAGRVMDAFRSGWQRRQQLDVGQDTHTFTHMQAKSLCDHSNEAESAKRSAKPQQHFSLVSPQLCVCTRVRAHARACNSGPAEIAPKKELHRRSHNAGRVRDRQTGPSTVRACRSLRQVGGHR